MHLNHRKIVLAGLAILFIQLPIFFFYWRQLTRTQPLHVVFNHTRTAHTTSRNAPSILGQHDAFSQTMHTLKNAGCNSLYCKWYGYLYNQHLTTLATHFYINTDVFTLK